MNPEDESRFTRVSVLGAHRNADVVIPSHAPLDLVMAQIAQILGEDVRQNYALARTTGGALRSSATLADEGVEDGTILMLTAVDRTPPSPTVFDLSEATEDVADNLPDRWIGVVRRKGLAAVASLALAAALLWAAGLLQLQPIVGVVGGAVLMVLLGTVLALAGSRETGRIVAVTGTLLALHYALNSADEHRFLILFVVAFLAAIGTARRRGGWIAGFASFAVVQGIWMLLDWLTEVPNHAGGVLGVLALLVLGILPQIALSTSGVFGAQRRTTEMRRAAADVLVVRAHDILAVSTLVLGLTIAWSVWVIITDPNTDWWGFGLAAALSLGTLLRSRSFPVAMEKLALWTVPLAAVSAANLRLVMLDVSLGWIGIGVLVVLAIALLVAAHASLPEHTVAQLRQIGNSLETFAIVVTIPVLVGQFGVYTELLEVLG